MSPTETDLEPRLIETLRAKAAQVPDVMESFDPDVVDLGGRDGRGTRPWLVAAAAIGFVVLAVAGLVIAFGGRDAGEPANPAPAVPVAGIAVDALPELRFQLSEYTTVPGLNEIALKSFGGTHGLVFDDPALADFRLDASAPGFSDRGTVTLEAGRDYTIYCPIPGHRAAGMEAVIHVSGPGERPTKGPMPTPMPTRPDGSVDVEQLPDFIPVASVGGSPGYVEREYLFGSAGSDLPQPVVAEDLETLVGYMYPGRGFVPLGVDPETVPFVSTTTLGSTTTTTAVP